FTTSNSFSTLNDEEEDDEEVENVYDELANLVPNTNTCGSSYFTAAAGLSSMMNDVREKLDGSSSMVFMTCNSGAIKLNRSYNPSGLIMDYILFGSSAIKYMASSMVEY
ncbi:hypothetical protein Tco_0572765, partial [Tanacetum coccineum]